MDASNRYPSPSSTSDQSGSASPMKLPDAIGEIQVRTDGPPPAKRRKVAERKPRTTEYIDLSDRDEEDEAQLDRLLSVLRKKKKIVVIAGAGISVSAGIPDFRSSHGLFQTLRAKHKIKGGGKSLFDASVYRDDKSTEEFHKMVRDLSRLTQSAKPTPFHHMLASLAEEGRLMRLYSQNVDCIDTSMKPLATTVPLNAKGPWPATIQLHGGLEKMVCTKCGQIDDFEASLFQGPEPPPCKKCEADDHVRTAFAGKRSHGIGRLRPRMVLYQEYHPDSEAIGAVSNSDLRRVPDAVIVVGTSLKVPGVQRIVKLLCRATRAKRDGFTAWINLESEPQGAGMNDLWDLVVKGKCDDIAELLNLPHWDEQDVGEKETYMVTGDEQKEEQYKRGVGRDRIDVLLQKKTINESDEEDTKPSEAKSKVVEQIQAGIPTPSASPRHQSPVPSRKALPKGKTKQSTLKFTGNSTMGSKEATAAKITKPRKPRQPKQDAKAKPKNALTKSFKATKNTVSVSVKTPIKQIKSDPESSDFSPPPMDAQDGLSFGLPSLRPSNGLKKDISTIKTEGESSPNEIDSHLVSNELDVASRRDTISPKSKPRSMGHLID